MTSLKALLPLFVAAIFLVTACEEETGDDASSSSAERPHAAIVVSGADEPPNQEAVSSSEGALTTEQPEKPETNPLVEDADAEPESPPQEAPAQEETDASLAEMIDSLAGHPDDPQLPKAALGASDEVILATNSREIADLLQVALPFAQNRARSPRFLFALGRAAIAHGYERRGAELLGAASKRGSAAATAYLGYLAEADGKKDEAAAHLRQAIEKGFDSRLAKETLASLTQKSGATSTQEDPVERFDPNAFNRPDFIQALHDGHLSALDDAGYIGVNYVAGIQSTLSDTGVLFLVDDPMVLLEVDPALQFHLGMKLVSSVGSMQDMTSKGMESLFGPLLAMAEARKSGKSIAGELSAATTASMKPKQEMLINEEYATQDGRRLAILYSTNPAAFRKVYAGMRAFA